MTLTTKSVSRRRVIQGAVAGASVLAAPAVLRRAHAAEPLRVSSYGGYFEDSLVEYIYPDVKKDTGIEVQSITQSAGGSWYATIDATKQSGDPPTDISMVNGQGPLRFTTIFQPLDESRLPNLKNVPPDLVHRRPDGRPDAVGVLTWYTTFVTNQDVIPGVPESWADAWDAKYEGMLGWQGTADTSYLLDIVAVTFFGGQDIMKTQDGLLQVLRKAAELKDNVVLWYRDEGQFQSSLQSGEIPAGQYYHDVTMIMAGDGYPVVSTFPKEGGVIDYGSWSLVEGSTRHDDAHVFIDYFCQPEVQAKISRSLGTAPTVPREMTDMTEVEFAAVSSDIAPIYPAYEVYVEHGDWISEKWTELITGVAE